ncbi:hypothetical protein MJM95_27575, partial [Salmonella enterica subsp. enterica serovar Anatum]|nr:hypothetical protein [Salmonella enterica subsp. enterica serovar Anatum]
MAPQQLKVFNLVGPLNLFKNTHPLNKHISGQFNAELESIRTQVMTMGGMVEQQLSDAITAMHNQD